MSANENSGEPRLMRELKASLSWLARRGTPVREAMAPELGDEERTVAEVREEESQRRSGDAAP